MVIANRRIQISATGCGATLSLSGIIKISSIEAGGGPVKQRYRSLPDSNMPENDVRDLLGIVPSNSFGTSSQAPVMVQYSQEMGDSQNQFPGAPSTINLQDLE